jgi:hypothetical protein
MVHCSLKLQVNVINIYSNIDNIKNGKKYKNTKRAKKFALHFMQFKTREYKCA